MTNALCSTCAIPVEHVTIRSTKPFEDVRANLATLAPRIDDGILEACPPLSIFGQRDHGALLTIAGLTRRSIQYDIGNPLRIQDDPPPIVGRSLCARPRPAARG
jgi:hypothetical protein